MADHSEDYDVDRSTDTPTRTDKRGILHMLHDEIGKHLGIGRAKEVGTQGEPGRQKALMETVDEAVKGAPDPGSEY